MSNSCKEDILLYPKGKISMHDYIVALGYYISAECCGNFSTNNNPVVIYFVKLTLAFN